MDSGTASSTTSTSEPLAKGAAAIAVVCRREHLRRTAAIAVVVGLFLNLVNQAGAIADGDATTGTWLRVALNFCVPFIVSNCGLVAGHWAEITEQVRGRHGHRR
jgi:hypothetical protein